MPPKGPIPPTPSRHLTSLWTTTFEDCITYLAPFLNQSERAKLKMSTEVMGGGGQHREQRILATLSLCCCSYSNNTQLLNELEYLLPYSQHLTAQDIWFGIKGEVATEKMTGWWEEDGQLESDSDQEEPKPKASKPSSTKHSNTEISVEIEETLKPKETMDQKDVKLRIKAMGRGRSLMPAKSQQNSDASKRDLNNPSDANGLALDKDKQGLNHEGSPSSTTIDHQLDSHAKRNHSSHAKNILGQTLGRGGFDIRQNNHPTADSFRRTQIGFKKLGTSLRNTGSANAVQKEHQLPPPTIGLNLTNNLSTLNASSRNILGRSRLPFHRQISKGQEQERSEVGSTMPNSSMALTVSTLHEASNPAAPINLLQLPCQVSQLLLDPNSSWTANLHRAHALTGVATNWCRFHDYLFSLLKSPCSQLIQLHSNISSAQQALSYYSKTMDNEPYPTLVTLLETAFRNLLVDEQLNRVGREFCKGHGKLVLLTQTLIKFNERLKAIQKASQVFGDSLLESDYQSNPDDPTTDNDSSNIRLLPGSFAEGLSTLDSALQQLGQFGEMYPETIRTAAHSLGYCFNGLLSCLSRVRITVDETKQFKKGPLQPLGVFSLNSLNYGHLAAYPLILQLLLQQLTSLMSRFTAVCQSSSFSVRFSGLKQVISHLWTITRYYGKLWRQLREKAKEGKKVDQIEAFLKEQARRRVTWVLMGPNNAVYAQEEVAQLKQRIQKLKQAVANNSAQSKETFTQ